MNALTMAATVAALLVVASAEAQSQNDARSVVDRKAAVGNRLTLTMADGTQATGRLVRLSGEDLVLQQEPGERSFRYAEIDPVQKRKNGVLLGALLGLRQGRQSDGRSPSCRITKEALDLMESGSHLPASLLASASMHCSAATPRFIAPHPAAG